MKINLISDIHATYDPKAGKVIYCLPHRKSQKKYIEAAKVLLEYWKNNKSRLSGLDYKKKLFFAEELHVVKSYNDAVDFLQKFYDAICNNYAGMSIDDMYRMSYALTNIDELVVEYGLNWKNGKTDCYIKYDLREHLYKAFGDFDPAKLESADYLIIAGDLGIDNIYDKILADIEEKTKGKFKKILHIAGNHDHWWHGIHGMQDKCPDKVNLSRDYSEHSDGEYLFLGCTMWTPLQEEAIFRVGRCMNDYRYAPNFSPYNSRELYAQQSAWLKKKIEENKDKKIVVFTHHQPFEELIHDDYKHNGKNWDGLDVNEAYVVTDHSLDDINKFGNIKLWCCGHTHKCFDGMLHDVHVVRNPIGYSDMYGKCPAENLSGTWYNKIIEV